jgi:serine/threonine protein phosphatase PrpC/uncharacterized coiled-coil protein SlyX
LALFAIVALLIGPLFFCQASVAAALLRFCQILLLLVVWISALLLQAGAQCLAARSQTSAGHQRVLIFPFGSFLLTDTSSWPAPYRVLVQVVGPMLNIAAAGVIVILDHAGMTRSFAVFNLIVGLFSLLPIWPLSGGALYKDWLQWQGGSSVDVHDRLLAVSRITCFCVALFAFLFGQLPVFFCAATAWCICHRDLFPGLGWKQLGQMSWKWLQQLGQQRRMQCLNAVPAWVVLAVAVGQSSIASELPPSLIGSNAVLQANPAAQITVLERRLDMLSDTLSALGGVVKTNEASVNRRIDAVATSVKPLEARIPDVSPLHARIAALENKTAKLEQKLVTIEGVLRTNQDFLMQWASYTQNQAQLLQRLEGFQIAHQRQCLITVPPPTICDHSWLWLAHGIETLLIAVLAFLFYGQAKGSSWLPQFCRQASHKALVSQYSPPAFVTRLVGSPVPRPATSPIAPPPALAPKKNLNMLGPPLVASTPASSSQPNRTQKPTSSPVSTVKHSPAPPSPTAIHVIEPVELLACINRAVSGRGPQSAKPHCPNGQPWSLGFASHRGNVRSENQDYGICFEMAGYQVAMVADGMGGLRFGRQAAYLAVRSASWAVVNALRQIRLWILPRPTPAILAQVAMKAATDRLAKEGARMKFGESNDGLRTTLIVIIGNSKEFGYAYSGDGGGIIVRSGRPPERFLEPQKADGGYANVLAGSLGPVSHGKPEFGSLPRQKGDLLMIGSDGVFDRVPETFAGDILRGAAKFHGNLQQTADLVLKELADQRDEIGYICDDNMSLALVGDGVPPVPCDLADHAEPISAASEPPHEIAEAPHPTEKEQQATQI